MAVNTGQWRECIGTFHDRIFFFLKKKACCDPIIIFKWFFNFFHNSFLSILVLKAGDIELNPGPNKKSHSYFPCCHWNVNSLPNENYCEVSALRPIILFINMIFYVLVKLFLISHLNQMTKIP